ncbi:MAG: hypothetical protein WCO08_06610, partial [Actinomycetes bacterium]
MKQSCLTKSVTIFEAVLAVILFEAMPTASANPAVKTQTIKVQKAPVKAGRVATTPVVNTILNGKGVPKSSLGKDGDFYLDTQNLNFYGPKSAGVWPKPFNLKGPAGSDGKNGANATSSTGLTGPQGERGPIGAVGPNGL